MIEKVRRLKDAGFTDDQISIILKEDGLDEKNIISLLNEERRIRSEKRQEREFEELLEYAMEIDPSSIYVPLNENESLDKAVIKQMIRKELEIELENKIKSICKEESEIQASKLWEEKIRPALTEIIEKLEVDGLGGKD
ncbi:MAG: hypothetical protein ACE5K4_03060 [Candidatus Hydrothermarchaeota archaeon]